MNFVAFSKKQKQVLTWWCSPDCRRHYDAVICDGAVRSGKTLCMSLSFILWGFCGFSETQSFGMCGKTITSLRRNVVVPLCETLASLGFKTETKISQNLLTVSIGKLTHRYYLFGGKDEGSAALVQGMTLSGVLFDEVALMPRSFVEQALARCSVVGSTFWFNCNPEHPGHWFYREWIQKYREKNALYLHFTMEDNPSLSEAIRTRYRSLYTGVFYERFIEGKWTAAEGLIYPFFSDRMLQGAPAEPLEEYYISCDYGTVNPTSMGLWGKKDGVWYRLSEYYYASKTGGEQKTDEEYYAALCRLAAGRPVRAVICDPSAASFMTCIRRHAEFAVLPAKNQVSDGIRQTAQALRSGKMVICEGCADAIREFSLYRWDPSGAEIPVKENDHAMDEIRYFAATVLARDPDEGVYAVAALRNG